MKGWAHWAAWAVRLAVALMLVASSSARAEVAPEIIIDAKDVAKCLVAPAKPIAYPTGAAERKLGGVIRVRLTFTSTDGPPRSEVFYDTVGDEFRQAVLDQVEGYRLPCLRAGESTVLTQEFNFDPGDGRNFMARPARDSGAPDRKAFSCLTGAERPPEYPRTFSANPKTQGTVIARFEVVSIDEPPRVEIVFDGGSGRFAAVVRHYIEGYRFPCLGPGDLPFKASQVFRFSMQGESQRVLNDLPLISFLRNVDHVEREHVRFDFATMGCPFDLRFELRRPYLENVVQELGREDPNRREFIEWLRHVEVNLAQPALAQVLGDEMTISVPCSVLDLR